MGCLFIPSTHFSRYRISLSVSPVKPSRNFPMITSSSILSPPGFLLFLNYNKESGYLSGQNHIYPHFQFSRTIHCCPLSLQNIGCRRCPHHRAYARSPSSHREDWGRAYRVLALDAQLSVKRGAVARVKTTHVQQPLRHTSVVIRHTSYAFGNQFFQIDFEILKPAITFN